MKLEELSKNTSASVRDHTSSDNCTHCCWRVLYGGATYRQYSTNPSGAPSIQRTTVNNNNNKGLSMSSNAKAVTLLWIPRKITEGPTRPLVNMNGKKPSEYYGLRKITLQDIAMNAIFDNYGCGYDSLPPPLQRMYHNHIYNYNNE